MAVSSHPQHKLSASQRTAKEERKVRTERGGLPMTTFSERGLSLPCVFVFCRETQIVRTAGSVKEKRMETLPTGRFLGTCFIVTKRVRPSALKAPSHYNLGLLYF